MAGWCKFTLHLDHPRGRYRSDEPLRGEVFVRALGTCTYERVKLRLQWEATGFGPSNRQWAEYPVGEGMLWREGEEHRYPFHIPFPNGPFSYQGKIFFIEWCLRLYADLEEVAKTPIILEPGVADEYCLGPRYEDPKEGYEQPSGLGRLSLSFLKKQSFWKKLGPPRVEIEPRLVRPGDIIAVKLFLSPKEKLPVEQLALELIGVEEVFESAKSGRLRKRESIHRQQRHLELGAARLSPGEESAFEVQFRLPPDVPLSFASYHYLLSWRIKVILVTRQGGALEFSYPITVYPGAVVSPFRG